MSRDDDDGSRPPPTPIPDRPSSRADWAVDKAGASIKISAQAITIATEARDTGRALVAMMGASPDPVRKVEGSGLLGGVALILERIEAMELAAARVAAARAWWSYIGRTALVVLGAIATVIGIVKAVR